ncbi:DUF1045 domain-containing protein [Chitiniphilus shinanonensis]|uniref:DUF1045 domain-containing protein n=1 Tax=Chitiniphilus shinanonensis TaxID=553088 RepID=UPI003074A384
MSYRYALYLAPPQTHPLWSVGNRWLGRDAERGDALTPSTMLGLDHATWNSLVGAPRRYGLHATLKAPFRLADPYDEAQLLLALEQFAATTAPFTLPPLQVTALAGFICLRPREESQALQALADACVAEFDRFRAPPAAAELERRRPGQLDVRARYLLERWGYPHVFERFRCHFTLTDPLPEPQRSALLPLLAAHFAPVLDQPLPVGELCLFVEDSPGAPFRLARRFALGSAL